MKKIFTFLLLVSITFFSVLANASVITGKIKSISVRETGHIVVILTARSTAACATVGQAGFYISSSNSSSKTVYAAFLAAQSQDRTVTIVGKNTCSWGTNEDILWVITNT